MQNLHRPKMLNEFIGQDKIKNVLDISIKSSRKRKKQLDHVLISGSQGMGKTTLANIIANELQQKIKFAQGPQLDRKSDILTLLASISEGNIVFIDEIHGINKNVEELIYSAMEDGIVDVILGPEGDSKVIRMKLPSFTLIGATTKLSKISGPLRDRFGISLRIPNYSLEEVKEIVEKNSKILNINIDSKSAIEIASHSRKNPRVAIHLLKRSLDYALNLEKNVIDMQTIEETFTGLGIYKFGLTETHISYLNVLADRYGKKYCSLDLLAGLLNESRDSIEHDIEPILIDSFLIDKTNRGRTITIEGMKYLESIGVK